MLSKPMYQKKWKSIFQNYSPNFMEGVAKVCDIIYRKPIFYGKRKQPERMTEKTNTQEQKENTMKKIN